MDDLIDNGHLIVSGQIFEAEMKRVAVRLGIDQQRATDVLESIELIEHEPVDFSRAGALAMPDLGSLDARLAAASETVGIPVLDITRPRTLH